VAVEMAVLKKPDGNKKERDKPGSKDAEIKETEKKGLVLKKDRKELVKKDAGKKDLAVKKVKVDRIDHLRKFFRGAFNELKKVHWPTRKEVMVYTSVVLVAVVAVGLLIWLFDSILSAILKLIVVR
jgi:preprotein translocase subunit SecE